MKYNDALYPDKINDLVNNDGTVNLPTGGAKLYKHSFMIGEREVYFITTVAKPYVLTLSEDDQVPLQFFFNGELNAYEVIEQAIAAKVHFPADDAMTGFALTCDRPIIAVGPALDQLAFALVGTSSEVFTASRADWTGSTTVVEL